MIAGIKTKLVLGAVSALALWLLLSMAHRLGYTQGQADAHATAHAAVQAATRSAAAQIVNTANTHTEAQHARTQTEQHIGTAAAGAGRELERLRRDLAAARSAARTAQAAATCTPAAAPEQQLLDAMARDIADLAEQGTRIARAADQHAADAVMLQAACGAGL